MGADETAPSEQNPYQRSGERRQLTVVFCDLLGSTQAAASLDPEELSDVLQVYQRHVAEAIGRYGGTVAQFLGDGVLAYFGYPQAHENDAECAVRAGLDIVGHMPMLAQSRFQLTVRIGIATGLVVIGHVRQTVMTGELLAVGETPNLAARLQAAAPRNGILIAESTRRLVGGLFQLSDPLSVEVKGISGPVTAYAVEGVSTLDSRFEALRGEATPFVGREEEVALIRRRWDQALSGDGRVVLFSGEPGIGKSRILDRARKELDVEAGYRLRLFCSPLHMQTALYPFLSYIRKAAKLEEQESGDQQLANLTAFLQRAFVDARTAAENLASFMGLASSAKPQSAPTAAQRKEAAIKVLTDYPIALSRERPVLIILEDAHWLDPTSIELLDRLVAAVSDRRILMIVSARPEYQPVWITHPSVTLASLSRFGWREGAAMIAGVAGGRALPAELTEQILERSDGVPLFLEELTKTLLDSGMLAESGGEYALQGQLLKVALPNTLQDLLTARLDRLGPVKALAQVGAAIGREFSHELLLAVSGKSDAELTDDLSKLLASGLIYRRGAPPEAVYFFKHALIQDAAYDTLLRSRRQQLHAIVAETILNRFPAVAANQPELIAHHLTAAEDFPRAIDYWLLAGKAHIQASADLEAIGHLQRGIALLGEIDDQTVRLKTELKLQTALVGSLVAIKGPFSREVAACCERGLQLSAAGVETTAFPFLYGQFTHSVSTGKLRQATDIARRFIQVSQTNNYDSGVVVGHRLLGLALLARGEFVEARHALETALSLYRPERDDGMTFLFGQNVKVNSQTVLSEVLYCLGERDQAKRIARECLATAEKLKHPHTTAISIVYAGLWVPWLDDDFDEVQVQAERLVSISTEFGLQLFAPWGRFFVGMGLFQKGQTEAGFAYMEGAIATLDRGSYKLSIPAQLSLLAKAKCEAGRLAEAQALSARARQLMEECEEYWFGPEIFSIEAEIAARANPPDTERARSFINQAIALAEKLNARGLEERARAVCDRLFPKEFALTP